MEDDGKDKSRFHERLNAEPRMVPSQGRGSNTLSIWVNCSNQNADKNARCNHAFGSKGRIA
jgi:hypothetical protein